MFITSFIAVRYGNPTYYFIISFVNFTISVSIFTIPATMITSVPNCSKNISSSEKLSITRFLLLLWDVELLSLSPWQFWFVYISIFARKGRKKHSEPISQLKCFRKNIRLLRNFLIHLQRIKLATLLNTCNYIRGSKYDPFESQRVKCTNEFSL